MKVEIREFLKVKPIGVFHDIKVPENNMILGFIHGAYKVTNRIFYPAENRVVVMVERQQLQTELTA